jgi:hypothetical protein
MPHPVNRRQKPAWQQTRKAFLPPPRPSGFSKKSPGRKNAPRPKGAMRANRWDRWPGA